MGLLGVYVVNFFLVGLLGSSMGMCVVLVSRFVVLRMLCVVVILVLVSGLCGCGGVIFLIDMGCGVWWDIIDFIIFE